MALSHPSYPVFLLLSGRACLVVGGNAEALRKCEGLLASGAVVTVIAEDPLDDFATLDLAVERRPYCPGEAAEYALVLATTGTAIDHQVYLDAEAAKVFVNATDDVANCSFIAPAIGRRDGLAVAVGTDGRSPAFATYLRDEILLGLPDGLDEILAVLTRTRAAVIEAGRATVGLPWRELVESLVDRAGAGEAMLDALGDAFLENAIDQRRE